MKIRVAIIGPTGYTGLYLLQLLARHPFAQVTYLASHREELPDIREVFPQLTGLVPDNVARCRPIDAEAMAREADVVFLGLPHRAAFAYAPKLLDAGLRVIDLSADYRLKDPALYAKVYGHTHEDPGNLTDAVYGLPELFRAKIPGAMLIANPGCYPTAAALAISPLLTMGLARSDSIIISAASGVTGGGRTPTQAFHFPEANEGFVAYGAIGAHRHQPEIHQTLSTVAGHAVSLLFVPHLLPIDRGILETIYLDPAEPDVTQEDLFEAYHKAYSKERFVRIRKDLPNVKHVRDTNFCDITARLVPADGSGGGPKIVVFSAIDNMIKGASGQAIQNMNIVFEVEESAGLI
jgi:N-acetyl-gamma-glutamyl-phosphate reductase